MELKAGSKLFLHSNLRAKSVLDVCKRFSSACDSKEGGSKCPKVMTKFPCGQPELQAKKEKKRLVIKAPSMWLNPFCDPDDTFCPFNPRFDDIYYVESDKAKRKYWQTWVACPPINIKPKKICCYAQAEPAPIKRRKPSAKPSTACPQPCSVPDDGDCPKLARRCYKQGRLPPSCLKERSPLNCVKPLTPYPSYSECDHPRPRDLHPTECFCLTKPMICEMWAMYRRKALKK